MIKKNSSKNSKSHFNVFSVMKTVSVAVVVLSLVFVFFTSKKKSDLPETISSENQEVDQTDETNKAAVDEPEKNEEPEKKEPKKKKKNNSKTIAKFASHFPTDETQTNRIFNIKKIAKTLNNTTIQPNETFSFQKIYDISKKGGKFKLARGIVNKKFSNNVYAGGICQVCTALFKAAEIAKLKIIERHRHSLPVPYGRGRTDSMFNDKTSDFKFKNTKTFPIKISSNVKDDYIEIKILKC